MPKDYNISKTAGRCAGCEKPLAPGEEFVATIRQAAEEFRRDDYCPQCWQNREKQQAGEPPDVFAVWHWRVPRPNEKKKLFADDELLINFFERLGGADDDVKVSFRFVLTLVLMRKKLLVYDRMEQSGDGTETWLMHLKGDDKTHRVRNPNMDEEKIAEVSGQLGQILEGQL